MNAPRISIIMVDGGFRESYHAIDFFCTQTFPRDDFELLWVEYGSQIHPKLAETVAKYPNARIITLGRTDAYHPSYCFNAGITQARAELLMIPDGDLVCEPDLLQRVWDEHQTNDKLVMYLYRYEEEEAEHQEVITLEHLRRIGKLRSPQNFGACLTVRKKWLLEINGYDQYRVFHTGFHANGRDVNVRLKNLGLHIMWHPDIKLYHPWHVFTKAPERYLYGRQTLVSDWRSVNLHTRAFDGIDPARNAPVSPELEAMIAQYEAAYAANAAISPAPSEIAPQPQGLKGALRKMIGRDAKESSQ